MSCAISRNYVVAAASRQVFILTMFAGVTTWNKTTRENHSIVCSLGSPTHPFHGDLFNLLSSEMKKFSSLHSSRLCWSPSKSHLRIELLSEISRWSSSRRSFLFEYEKWWEKRDWRGERVWKSSNKSSYVGKFYCERVSSARSSTECDELEHIFPDLILRWGDSREWLPISAGGE